MLKLIKYKLVDKSEIYKRKTASQFERYLEGLFKKSYDAVFTFLSSLKEHLEPKLESGIELTARIELLELEFEEELRLSSR